MNLALDIGNSSVKAGLFKHKELQEIWTYPYRRISDFEKIANDYPEISHCIISSVVNIERDFLDDLTSLFKVVMLNHTTDVPIINKYGTPETLGNDRLASAVAAKSLYPGRNIVVVEAGTCLKFEFISSHGEYLGGSISPGLNMRFKALNQFTDKLPVIHPSEIDFLIGNSTKDSILSGVINGIIAEVDGMIDSYKEKYEALAVIASGGDHNFFVKKLKNPIFAFPNLVLHGLNEILIYNVEKI